MGKPFQTKLRVRFGDVDRAGIAYFPRIVGYFHYAFEEFWENFAGVPYHELINKEHLGFPTVHMDVDFLRPLSFGDTLSVRVWVAKMGRSSCVFRYHFLKGKRLCVTANLTLVAVHMKTFKSRAIPQKYRKLFLRCAV